MSRKTKPSQRKKTSLARRAGNYQKQASKVLDQEFNKCFSTESDVIVEGLTDKKIDAYDWDKEMDIPTVYAAPIDDFVAHIRVGNELIKARWLKYSFSRDTTRYIQSFYGLHKVIPVCVLFFEGFGTRIAHAICHDPSGKPGNCTVIEPLLIGKTSDKSKILSHYGYNALCIIQNEILHRRKQTHKLKESPLPDDIDSTIGHSATGSKISKHKTIIRLSNNVVNVYTSNPERQRWTLWWIVGAHFRTTERKTPNGTVEQHVVKIDAYLKGPERNSEEAKSFFEAYLRTKESKEINIEIH